ncbi:MAG: LysM peptidoglycan-binding domain-containing protein [Blastocatellia bacterium]|nr:LysM peptidoglycan-binding domain-containing protein [Blastocatellia bacterium]
MPLEKMKIKNLDNGDQFTVLFNPTEYSIEEGNTWEEQKRERQKPELQFTSQSLKKLSMELFLDTYEQKEDVRIYTSKMSALLVVTVDDGNNGKRPPKVELSWGPADPNPSTSIFPFVCILESLKQQFTLFTGEGMPVRAKLSVAFKEFRSPTEQAQDPPRAGSFPDQTYTVKTGDTLSSIAATQLRDPFKWRLLAEANEIDNPRILEAGRILIVPAIE